MKKYDIFYTDEYNNYKIKTVKTKRTANKYIKELCMKYGECSVFEWVDGVITNSDIYTRKEY